MKKDCQPSPPARKRRITKNLSEKQMKASRLEEKVDGLMDLLMSVTKGASVVSSGLDNGPTPNSEKAFGSQLDREVHFENVD
jgi:hypothetical protein